MFHFERTAFFENDNVFEKLENEFNFEVTIAWRGGKMTMEIANFYEFDEVTEVLEYSFEEGYIDSMVIKLNDGTELVIF